MPPRFAYWTILIDGKPTAFRARDPQELLPTLNQLKRTNTDVLMRWFARGRLWESPEAERAAAYRPKVQEKRGREWRPGGNHKDPRARFDRKKSAQPTRDHDREPPTDARRGFGPRTGSSFRKRPASASRGSFDTKPPVGNHPHGGRPPFRRPSGRPPRQDGTQFTPQGRRPSPPRRDGEPGRGRSEQGGTPPPAKPGVRKPDPRKRR